MRIKTSVLAATLIAGMFTIGVDVTTFASTGHSVILGHVNRENHRTTLARQSKGSALALRTRTASPPLTVTSTTKVTHLNADTVDGFHASQLRSTARTYILPVTDDSSAISLHIPVTPGTYQVIMQTLINRTDATSPVECFMSAVPNPATPTNPAFKYFLHSFAPAGPDPATANGDSVFSIPKGVDDIAMQCSTPSGGISFASSRASRVILIPMAGQTVNDLPTPPS